MPPKNRKNADAVHAMKSYGISEVKTRAVLKNLLKLYDNNWQFIIEDGYKLLLEAILDKETEKEEMKRVKKEAPSYDKTEVDELSTMKIYTRRQTKQALFDPTYSLKTAPSRKENASDDDLSSHSSSDEPFLLRSYSLKHPKEGLIDDSKGVRYKNKEAPSDTEVAELPTKRLCARKKEKKAISLFESCLETARSRSGHPNDDALFSDSSSEDSLPLLKRLKFKNGGAPSYDQTEVLKLQAKKLYEPNQQKQASPLFKTCWETTQSRMAHQSDGHMFSDSEESQPLFTRTRRNIGSVHNCNPVHVENPNPTFIDISSDSDGCNSYQDEEILGLLEVEPLNMDYTGRVSDLSMVGVLSSPPKGEVETPLICCSPPQHDERTRLGDAPELKSSDLQVLSTKDDCQGNNCTTPRLSELFVFQNLVKIVPHIPRHMIPSGFEWVKHLKDFTIVDIEKTCGEIGKILKALQDPQSSKLLKLEAACKDLSSLGVVKSSVYIDDITRGEERMKISLENGRNIEDLPAFFYIPENLVYKNAYVKFSLDHISNEDCCTHCYGDCLASSIPCICTIETRGGFAYTPGGLLEEKFLEDCVSMKRVPEEHYFYCKNCPLESSDNNMNSMSCKGHLFRKFLKECWSKCGCNKNCGNRIVQRGITVKLQVFLSPEGKGWGLRTLEDLPRGTFVCEYVGEIVTNTELYERNLRSSGKKHTYPVILDAEWSSESVLKDEEALCLDATVYGNVARFINHRCFDASLIEIPVEFETPDHHYYHVAFFTTRNVAAMEELTWDYGIDFNDRNHPLKAFRCLCRSSLCRGRHVEEIQA